MSEAAAAPQVGASPNTAAPANGGYYGAAWFFTPGSRLNTLDFLIRQVIAGKAFAGLAEVKAVHGGGVGAPPTVDVQPVVSQSDGLGNLVPHDVVHGLPCFRLQSGSAAVILDPVVGDIGDVIICHRDHSNVIETGAVSGPGSRRQNSWADGMYFGSFLGPTPTTYLHLDQGGNATLTAPGTVTINTPTAVVQNPNGTLVLQLFDLPVADPSPTPDQVWRPSGPGPSSLAITAGP
jgi:hypothetical protein